MLRSLLADRRDMRQHHGPGDYLLGGGSECEKGVNGLLKSEVSSNRPSGPVSENESVIA